MFVSQTGLELSYIKIEKEKTTGFVRKSEDTKVSIILGNMTAEEALFEG